MIDLDPGPAVTFKQVVDVALAVRPHPGATVSAPLKWSEVKPTLDPARQMEAGDWFEMIFSP